MSFLLDTQVWLWGHIDPDRLGEGTRRLLVSADARLYLSAVSVLEIAIKLAQGKIRLPGPLDSFVSERVQADRLIELPVTSRHAIEVGRLEWHHRDPFDRLLIAQARCEGLTLVSGDERILRYGGRVMDAR